MISAHPRRHQYDTIVYVGKANVLLDFLDCFHRRADTNTTFKGTQKIPKRTLKAAYVSSLIADRAVAEDTTTIQWNRESKRAAEREGHTIKDHMPFLHACVAQSKHLTRLLGKKMKDLQTLVDAPADDIFVGATKCALTWRSS